MDKQPIKILLIEDNPADARLIREMLVDTKGESFETVIADRLFAGLTCLASNAFDVILLDLSLPDSQGSDTFMKVRERAAGVPIVLLTGLDDEVLAMGAMNKGAQDYLIKGEVSGHLLARAIRYAIERNKLLRELQDALAKVKTLSGMIPICAWCRKVRNDKGYWDQVEAYIENHSNATFTHGICPECSVKLRKGTGDKH
jgi:two-component system cell cycle sensor histidine kinase/response regulator CckA